jgi:hypothetical protein
MINELKTLELLCQAYFHQDYDLEFDGTIDGALAGFVEGYDEAQVVKLIKEIDYLIANPVDDWDNLIYKKLGSSYHYQSDWSSAIDWLRHLRDETDKLLNQKTTGST